MVPRQAWIATRQRGPGMVPRRAWRVTRRRGPGIAPRQAWIATHQEAPRRARAAARRRTHRVVVACSPRWPTTTTGSTTGSFVSNIGTWMQRVAQDWLVLELSGGSAVALGVTTGLQFLPMLLLSPYGGLIADRFDKRQVLKVTQLWLSLCAATLGILAITGLAETWHVYLLALLFGVGTAFDNPARQAFVPEVVGAEHLPNAIGLNSAAFHAARIVGPALAGLVIAAVGSGWAILGNGVTYAAFIAGLTLSLHDG